METVSEVKRESNRKYQLIAPLSNGLDPVAVDAIVDSGAAYTWVPSPALLEMGVKPTRKRQFKVATGRIIEGDVAQVQIEVKGEKGVTWVVFGDPGSDPLLGAITLEEFSFGIDTINKTLIPVMALVVHVS